MHTLTPLKRNAKHVMYYMLCALFAMFASLFIGIMPARADANVAFDTDASTAATEANITMIWSTYSGAWQLQHVHLSRVDA